MVTLEQVTANIRFLSVEGERVSNIRTFSGVRHNVSGDAVGVFMRGIGRVSDKLPTNALLTTRAAITEGGL